MPVGRPQTIVVDMTGRWRSASREVRLVTNMRIYWDRILVAARADDPVRVRSLEPEAAGLRWRGFSRAVSPDGAEPFGADYHDVSTVSPWKAMPGRYTREGDVRSLLGRVDDMFVVSASGDEIALAFDARRLPRVREGWTRTFLLFVDGFSKEMDINSSSPDQLSPLPFHAMSDYPYPASESYPRTPAHRRYLERFNTRVIGTTVPSVESSLLGE
jgi:hypothetical protein